MTRPLIYMTNSTATTVAAGANVPLGGITRKVGSSFAAGTSSVYINTPGYYSVDFAGTFTGTAGNVKINLVQNGTTIASATETIGTATTEAHSVSIPAIARVYCCAGATITVAVDSASSGTPTFSSTELRMVKE